MTIYFISGFGEDELIFSKIQNSIPGIQVFINLWDLVGDERKKDIDISAIATQVITDYGITESDLVIGHSTGGWLALHIKNQINCCIVQIAGWTDHAKVLRPISNRHVIYLAVRLGLVYNPLIAKFAAKRYKGRPSRDIFLAGYYRLVMGKRSNVLNQLGLIFNPYSKPIHTKPDLAIHAKGDDIIEFPDGDFFEVEGDHFSLYTHPKQVIQPIIDLMETKSLLNENKTGDFKL